MLKHVFTFLMLPLLIGLTACNAEKTGPEPIYWDRDSCELCAMIISDARFAAQVRGGEKRKVYKFDDVGCAVNWLNDQTWAADEATEIWVADRNSTRDNMIWLKARDAYYVKGEISPMNYGYVATNDPEGIDFVAMTTTILADAPNHICKVPERNE
ncbi:MAG: nitrous oxide reductase accessory protein NosL [Magnetovibrio sp.]|nr:nitrous oxide reductase accessory protein NosL [Magnetovibrio sp.]